MDETSYDEQSQSSRSKKSTTSQSLCRRCGSLQLDSYVESENLNKFGTVASITTSSLHDDCGLCIQFGQLFQSTVGLPRLECDEEEKISISCHRLYKDEKRKDKKDMYFNFQFNYRSPSIRFFLASSSLEGNQTDLAKIVSSDQPDFEFVRRSLDACRGGHSRGCNRPFGRIEMLRLIDCKTRWLIVREPNQRYVCLSYVWGKDAVQPIIFSSKLPATVPKTVEDAMFVATSLDIPYL